MASVYLPEKGAPSSLCRLLLFDREQREKLLRWRQSLDQTTIDHQRGSRFHPDSLGFLDVLSDKLSRVAVVQTGVKASHVETQAAGIGFQVLAGILFLISKEEIGVLPEFTLFASALRCDGSGARGRVHLM